MSQENIDATYSAIDAFNRRDLPTFLALLDPSVELRPYEVAVQGDDPYRGHTGARTWWEESLAVLPDLKGEIDEVQARGDMTFVAGRVLGRGAGSGVPIERPLWQAARWRDGKLVWMYAFMTRGEALEAAGLKE